MIYNIICFSTCKTILLSFLHLSILSSLESQKKGFTPPLGRKGKIFLSVPVFVQANLLKNF